METWHNFEIYQHSSRVTENMAVTQKAMRTMLVYKAVTKYVTLFFELLSAINWQQ